MERLPEDFTKDIQKLFDTINPGNLLLAGRSCISELVGIASEKNIQHIYQITGDSMYSDICTLGMFDLVILTDIEEMQKKEAMQLIGRIRDFHARHMLVMALTDTENTDADFTSHWERGDFIACGMRLFRNYPAGGVKLSVYRFELSDYKITPEWFNSKYWANPELFDKYRW